MAPRTRKILVMIPAGEVYDHDCVRWYKASDKQRSIEHYHNIGDAFVFDSSLKLLDYDRIEFLKSASLMSGRSISTTQSMISAF